MSIYPVKLSEWFPLGYEYHNFCRELVKSSRCLACGDRVNWKKAIGHHSIPWGHGDIWCDEKCLDSGKTAKPDKRRMNRTFRKFKKLGWV